MRLCQQLTDRAQPAAQPQAAPERSVSEHREPAGQEGRGTPGRVGLRRVAVLRPLAAPCRRQGLGRWRESRAPPHTVPAAALPSNHRSAATCARAAAPNSRDARRPLPSSTAGVDPSPRAHAHRWLRLSFLRLTHAQTQEPTPP